jgi:hypothetical protein
MPKTAALLIRFTPEDRARLDRATSRIYLDTSTWARQQLLLALEALEAASASRPAPKRTAARKTG